MSPPSANLLFSHKALQMPNIKKTFYNVQLAINHTSATAIRCWRMCRVNIACDRDDWEFMLVLAVVRHKAPIFKHCIAYIQNEAS